MVIASIVGAVMLTASNRLAAEIRSSGRRDSLYEYWSDGDFGSNWTVTTESNSSRCHVATSYVSSGGNPGAYRWDSITFDSSPKNYVAAGCVLSVNTSAQWSPSSITFSRIVFSYDLYAFPPADLVYQGPLVYQGGNYFIASCPYSISSLSTWTVGSQFSLAATDFVEIDPTTLELDSGSHPDFSSAGGTVTCGYALWGSHTTDGHYTTGKTGIDNWYCAVYETP